MRRINGHYADKNGNKQVFDFKVADCWEDLDEGQLKTTLEVLSYRRADKFVVASSLVAILFQKYWKVVANLPVELLHELPKLTNFMIETLPPVKNQYPKLVLEQLAYYAPDEDLGNINFGEWCFMYQAWFFYKNYNDPLYLDTLIAILYRPEDPEQKPGSPTYTGDIREVFNENNIKTRLKAVDCLSTGEKQTILAWFNAALINVMSSRPNVFPENKNTAVDDQPDLQELSPERTWFSVFRELLGPKWGTEKQLKFTNAMFVLDGLEEQQIEFNNIK